MAGIFAMLVMANIFGTLGIVIDVRGELVRGELMLVLELTAIGDGPPFDLFMHFSM